MYTYSLRYVHSGIFLLSTSFHSTVLLCAPRLRWVRPLLPRSLGLGEGIAPTHPLSVRCEAYMKHKCIVVKYVWVGSKMFVELVKHMQMVVICGLYLT